MKTETIKILHPEQDVYVEVNKEDYIVRKTRDLKLYGYNKLTVDEVRKSVDKILSGEPAETVIDRFIKSDIKQ